MLLPADTYIVVNKSIITELDQKIITDLYQPIIGHKAVSFYNTLLNDLERNDIMTKSYNHHHLLSTMQVSLTDITMAREKLEAVGLMKTYLKKDEINNYVYVLYSPYSVSEFFNHPLLNVILYNNVGKKEYDNLIQRYRLPRFSLKDYEDITTTFDKVFTSLPAVSSFANQDVIRENKQNLTFSDSVDFDLLISGLNSNLLTEKSFTKDIRHLITSLMFIYNIDISTMQNLIKNCINSKGSIDKDELRKSSRNYYQFEHGGNLPTVIYNKQPEYLKTPTGDNSKKAKMIYTFENTSPYQFLKSKYKDGKVISRDLALIETLLLDVKLTPGVVNVLLDYALKVNNQRLSKAYVLTIASSWKRLSIETVSEAMNACIKEYNKQRRKAPTNKKEIVPDWFNEKQEKKEVNSLDKNKMEELLSKYS